jgi:hypothetical protein
MFFIIPGVCVFWTTSMGMPALGVGDVVDRDCKMYAVLNDMALTRPDPRHPAGKPREPQAVARFSPSRAPEVALDGRTRPRPPKRENRQLAPAARSLLFLTPFA